jgi:hypothetical protein
VDHKRNFGLPKAPRNRDSRHDIVSLGVLTMIVTVFFGLVGQGCPPREALVATLALGLGGAEVIKRWRHDDGGRR